MVRQEHFELLKMLFEEHHRQLASKRQKIHSIAERTTALLLIASGWMIVKDKSLPTGVHWIIIGVVAFIAGAACYTIYRNNVKYFEVARVICKINKSLSLFELNKYYPGESLYPDKWKNFGEKVSTTGFIPHWCMIIGAAALCIVLALSHAN